MKKIYLMGAAALLALSTVSCVENSSKYKNVVNQNSVLQSEKADLQAEYNETLSIINDIENGFAAIRESEGKLMVDISNIEGQTPSKKEQLAVQMKQAQDIIAENKTKIKKLQARVGQNNNLKKTITRLEGELNEKSAALASLQSELESKNIKIEELNGTVAQLDKNIAELNTQNEQQREEIKEYDTNLNKAWFCVADDKSLKEAQIVTKNGLFSKQVMNAEFNKEAFTQIDIRDIASIETTGKRVKLLTSHPSDSYALEQGEDENVVIKILSPEKFWSVSKYLVVKI